MDTLLLVLVLLFSAVVILMLALLAGHYVHKFRRDRRVYRRACAQRHRRVLRHREEEQNLWRRQRFRDVVRLLLRKGLVKEGIPIGCQLPGAHPIEVHVRRHFARKNPTEQDALQETVSKELDERMDPEVLQVLRTPLADLLAQGRPPDALEGPDLLQLLLLRREDFLLQQQDWEIRNSAEGVAGLLRVSLYDENDDDSEEGEEANSSWWTRQEEDTSAVVTHTFSTSWSVPQPSMVQDEREAEEMARAKKRERLLQEKGDVPKITVEKGSSREAQDRERRSHGGRSTSEEEAAKPGEEILLSPPLPVLLPTVKPPCHVDAAAERKEGEEKETTHPWSTTDPGRSPPPHDRAPSPTTHSVWFSPPPVSPNTAMPLPPPLSFPSSSTIVGLDDGEPSSPPLFSFLPTRQDSALPFPLPTSSSSSASSSSFVGRSTASSAPPPLSQHCTDGFSPTRGPSSPCAATAPEWREGETREENDAVETATGGAWASGKGGGGEGGRPPSAPLASSTDPNADVMKVITHFLSDITTRPLHEVMQDSYSVLPVGDENPQEEGISPTPKRRERKREKEKTKHPHLLPTSLSHHHQHHKTKKKHLPPHIHSNRPSMEEKESEMGAIVPAPMQDAKKKKRGQRRSTTRSASSPDPSALLSSTSSSFSTSSSSSCLESMSREGARCGSEAEDGPEAEMGEEEPHRRGTLGPADRLHRHGAGHSPLCGEGGESGGWPPPSSPSAAFGHRPTGTPVVVVVPTSPPEGPTTPSSAFPNDTSAEAQQDTTPLRPPILSSSEGGDGGGVPTTTAAASPASPFPLTLPTTDRNDIKRLLRRHRQQYFPPLDAALVYGNGVPYTINPKNKSTRKLMLRQLHQSTVDSIEMELSLSMRPGSFMGKEHSFYAPHSSSSSSSPSASASTSSNAGFLRFFSPHKFRPSEKKNGATSTTTMPHKKMGSPTRFHSSYSHYPSPLNTSMRLDSCDGSVSVGTPEFHVSPLPSPSPPTSSRLVRHASKK